MLNKPKFMIPSTNMQECVVDLNSDKIPFSCIVDGNEAIVSWEIRIYKLSDNSLVYDSGIVDISNKPFFPVDEKNRNVVFEVFIERGTFDALKEREDGVSYYYKDNRIFGTGVDDEFAIHVKKGDRYPKFYTNNVCTIVGDPEDYQDKGSYAIFNDWNKVYEYLCCYGLGTCTNSKNVYYWTISFKGSSGTEVQSNEEVFYANSQVEGEIQYSKDGESYSSFNSTPLQYKKYYFKSTYTQFEGVGLKRYGWRITDTDNNRVLLDTISKNQIYGTYDNIICEYDGFLSDSNYSIELYIETQNGAVYLSEPQHFKILYSSTFLDGEFIPDVLNSEPGIMIRWDNITIASGRLEGKEQFLENFPVDGDTSIKLNGSSAIIYDYNGNANLDIPDDSYITLSTRIDSTESRTLFLAEGIDRAGNNIARKLSYVPNDSNGVLSYVWIKGDDVLTTEYDLNYKPFENIWYIIVMYPEQSGVITLKVTESIASGGLYPSDTLYPRDDLYPRFGIWDKLKPVGTIASEVDE